MNKFVCSLWEKSALHRLAIAIVVVLIAYLPLFAVQIDSAESAVIWTVWMVFVSWAAACLTTRQSK